MSAIEAKDVTIQFGDNPPVKVTEVIFPPLEVSPGRRPYKWGGIRGHVSNLMSISGEMEFYPCAPPRRSGRTWSRRKLKKKLKKEIERFIEMMGDSITVDELYNGMIAEMGLMLNRNNAESRSQRQVIDQFQKLRNEVSSVNMDEEVADMVQFQRGFDASAKFITTVDEMTQTVINMWRKPCA